MNQQPATKFSPHCTSLDPKTLARTYAPHLIAGGAILGVIAGFATPKVFRRVITWGVPLAVVVVTIKNARERDEHSRPLDNAVIPSVSRGTWAVGGAKHMPRSPRPPRSLDSRSG